MIDIYLIIAVGLVLAGAVLGALAILCIGIHREERAGTLTSSTDDRAASSTRRVVGLYVRAQTPRPPAARPPASRPRVARHPFGAANDPASPDVNRTDRAA